MRVIYSILLMILTNNLVGQTNEYVIKDNTFKFVTTTVNNTEQRDYITVYKDEIKLLEHTIYEADGDCSSENLQLGTFKVHRDKIVFYTYWAGADSMGKNIYPFGFKKQTYLANADGTISLENSIVYVEDYINSYETPAAIALINKSTITVSDKNLLEEYKASIEKKYQGDFVTGKKLDELAKEVRAKLKSEIKEHTSSWKEVYGVNNKS